MTRKVFPLDHAVCVWFIGGCFALCLTPITGRCAVEPVSKEAETVWLRHLLPLPHEVTITNQVVVGPDEVAIKLRSGGGDVEKQAVSELRELIKEKADGSPEKSKFEILTGVMDDKGRLDQTAIRGAERLKGLPNASQAYLIQPEGDRRLLITGLHEKGVYYGVRTLCQLLETKITTGQVTIPLATVVDWPDFEERGVWNCQTDNDWLASIKLNFRRMDGFCKRPIQRNQNIEFIYDRKGLDHLRCHAFVPVVMLTHVNFLNRPDQGRLFEAYPELAGQGQKAWQVANPHEDHRVPCASHPQFKRILVEIMRGAAEQGLRDFDFWQSEFVSSCECKQCAATGKGQVELEAEVCVSAWREVCRQYSDFKVRIFFSLADGTPSTRRALQALPPEVKIEYPYGEQTPFDECAQQGRWVGHWLAPTYRRYSVSPLKQFIQELRVKHWKGVCGYSGVPFSHAALAEWAWNTQGRTEWEFYLAWATREKYAQPDQVVAWVELMGPLDEYARPSWSEPCVTLRRWPQAVKETSARLAKWNQAADYLANAEKALALAGQIGPANLVSESEQSCAFYRLLQASVELARVIDDASSPSNRDSRVVQAAIEALHKAVLDQTKLSKTPPEFGEPWFETLTKNLSKVPPYPWRTTHS